MLSDAAWGFFSADSVALLALMGQVYGVKQKANKAEKNTRAVSNGTIPAIKDDVAFIKKYVISLSDRVDSIERKIDDHVKS